MLYPAHRGGQTAKAEGFTDSNNVTYTVNTEDATTVTVSGYDGAVPATLTISASVTNERNTYSVTAIGNRAFAGCTSFTSITLPETLTAIGESAFYNCTSLESITLPNSITSIGESAFYNCTSLESITLPSSLTMIGMMAFQNCKSLTSITLPKSLETIEQGTFQSCTALANITLPSSLENIGMMAFMQCNSLTSITLPSSLTTIGMAAFKYCNKLGTVTALSASPKSIENEAFTYTSNPTLYTVSEDAKTAYEGSSWSSFFTSIEVIKYTLEISTAGYATFSAPIATTIPEGLTAYYASESTTNEITLTKITDNIIPAYQGVVIQGAQDSYTINPSTSEGTKLETNLLSNTAYASGKTVAGDYVLAVNPSNSKVGFYTAKVGIDIPVNKAFYHVATTTANQSKGFTFTDDGLTGINDATIESGSTLKTYYNLNGTVENSPKSGKMYIVNGKTVILK